VGLIAIHQPHGSAPLQQLTRQAEINMVSHFGASDKASHAKESCLSKLTY